MSLQFSIGIEWKICSFSRVDCILGEGNKGDFRLHTSVLGKYVHYLSPDKLNTFR